MWQRPCRRGQRCRRIAPSGSLDRVSSVSPRRESGECEARKSNRRSGAPRTANVDGAARRWKDHGAGTGKRARMLASHWRRRSESAKTGQLQTHPHCLRDLRLSHSSVFVDSSARSQQQPASSVAQFGFSECQMRSAHRADTKAAQRFWLWRLLAWCSATSERARSIPSKPC